MKYVVYSRNNVTGVETRLGEFSNRADATLHIQRCYRIDAENGNEGIYDYFIVECFGTKKNPLRRVFSKIP